MVGNICDVDAFVDIWLGKWLASGRVAAKHVALSQVRRTTVSAVLIVHQSICSWIVYTEELSNGPQAATTVKPACTKSGEKKRREVAGVENAHSAGTVNLEPVPAHVCSLIGPSSSTNAGIPNLAALIPPPPPTRHPSYHRCTSTRLIPSRHINTGLEPPRWLRVHLCPLIILS